MRRTWKKIWSKAWHVAHTLKHRNLKKARVDKSIWSEDWKCSPSQWASWHFLGIWSHENNKRASDISAKQDEFDAKQWGIVQCGHTHGLMIDAANVNDGDHVWIEFNVAKRRHAIQPTRELENKKEKRQYSSTIYYCCITFNEKSELEHTLISDVWSKLLVKCTSSVMRCSW